jgi:hypothetical protein
MSTIELKKLLKLRIDAIDDEAFLVAINVILDSKSETIMILSEEQKKSIQNSQNEYLEGNYFENDSVNEEMKKWLQEE